MQQGVAQYRGRTLTVEQLSQRQRDATLGSMFRGRPRPPSRPPLKDVVQGRLRVLCWNASSLVRMARRLFRHSVWLRACRAC